MKCIVYGQLPAKNLVSREISLALRWWLDSSTLKLCDGNVYVSSRADCQLPPWLSGQSIAPASQRRGFDPCGEPNNDFLSTVPGLIFHIWVWVRSSLRQIYPSEFILHRVKCHSKPHCMGRLKICPATVGFEPATFGRANFSICPVWFTLRVASKYHNIDYWNILYI